MLKRADSTIRNGGIMTVEKLKEWVDKISYTTRRSKQLGQYENRFQKYLKMDEVEFLMDYTKATSKYIENKTTFGFSWISTIVALVATLYGYIVSVKAGIENANFSTQETEIIMRVSIVIGLLILGIAAIILATLSQRRYEIIQEKVFMEEMKELRIKNFDREH